jgi:NAD-dependent dihydropyrimidine dehydrogenase PreA subunit
MSENKSILVCQCCERGLVNNDELAGLIASGQAYVVSDLCEAAADKDPVFEAVASAEHPVIHACHPRAVRALFDFVGSPLPESTEFVNHRTLAPAPTPTPTYASNPAWYPVIEADRCTNCGQCFEFCLFGVYEKDKEGRVVVTTPQACKNNCPACARICPETAIIFPKVGESPINGAELPAEEERKANLKINVDEILGDDVYATLNARKQKRRSLLNKKKIEKALAERSECSEKKR